MSQPKYQTLNGSVFFSSLKSAKDFIGAKKFKRGTHKDSMGFVIPTWTAIMPDGTAASPPIVPFDGNW